MELTWFRRPAGDDPGTLNLCYNALDLHVVRGRAAAPAVRTSDRTVDYATLVEQSAALAGAMHGLGVDPGGYLGSEVTDDLDRLLVLLAALRLGAVYVDGDSAGRELKLVVEEGEVQPAVKSGRNDPAPCLELPPGSTAYVFGGEAVTLVNAADHPSWLGRVCATLCSGDVLDLAATELGDRR